jgi:hypothetical protein
MEPQVVECFLLLPPEMNPIQALPFLFSPTIEAEEKKPTEAN